MAAATFLDLVSGIFTQKRAVEAGPATSPTEQMVSTNASGVVDITLMAAANGTPPSTAKLQTAAQIAARSLAGV